MEAIAKGKYLRGSPQKARLVIDLIRGKNVAQALAILQFTNKRATENIEKCLRSAISNATFKAEQDNIAIDPDDLWVKTCFVDMGPHKNRRRVRPAPQGRAFREQRHYCHITIALTSDKPKAIVEKEEKAKAAIANKPKGRKISRVLAQTTNDAPNIVEDMPSEPSAAPAANSVEETVGASQTIETTQTGSEQDAAIAETKATDAATAAETVPAEEVVTDGEATAEAKTGTAATEKAPANNEKESTSEEKKTD